MKRFTSLLLTLALGLLLAAPALAAGPAALTFALNAEGAAAENGYNVLRLQEGVRRVTVTFSVLRTDAEESYPLDVLQDEIEYDMTFFDLVGGSVRTIYPSGAVSVQKRVRGQEIFNATSMAGQPYQPTQAFCSFTLAIRDGASGTGWVRSSNTIAVDADYHRPAITHQDLLVAMPGQEPVAPPPPAAAGDASAAPDAQGDTQGDIQLDFTDVDPNAWYRDSLAYVLERGIMSGYGNGAFGPNDSATRAQFATILWNLEGKPLASAGSFVDVTASDWFSGAVGWAAETGIVSGYTKNRFAPNDPLTRQQLVTMLYRYAKAEPDGGSLHGFADLDAVSDWAADAMRWAVSHGIITGRSQTRLSPDGIATRAEIAAIIMRFQALSAG